MPTPAFSTAEYADRLARLRAAMAAADLDLLWLSDPSNMAWLTGYDGWSFYVHQGVLVAHDRDPVFWGRAMDAVGARLTCWMDPDLAVPYPDHFVQSTERHPMTHLAGVITELGGSAARVGVEMDNYYYSAKAHAVLSAALPTARLTDATGLANWQRVVKSEAEITFMRRAARTVEAMHAVIRDVAEPGLPKNRLVAEISRAGLIGTDGHGGDYPAIVPLLPSGRDAAAAHLTWDDAPMAHNTATFFEIAGVYRRYHCPQCRTLYLGTPPDTVRAAEAAVMEALDAAIDAARPGALAQDVAAALTAAFNRHGIEKDGRSGYCVGLSYPPDWGERTVSIRAGDKTPLRAGMTFHLMPGVWFDDWGLEITETILIREAGPAEPLAQTPREIVVKP